MSYLLEILFAMLVTYLFINRENPKLKYLFYGYGFFLVAILLQIPFKYLQSVFVTYLDSNILPAIALSFGTVIISEFTKYFSLKKFVKTRSFKNGILFGIGWSTIESINYFTIAFFTFLFSYIGVQFNYSFFLTEHIPFINFIFFFVNNIAITTLVIISVIKNKLKFLMFAILYSTLIYLGLLYLDEISKAIFSLITLSISIYIIFNYKKFR